MRLFNVRRGEGVQNGLRTGVHTLWMLPKTKVQENNAMNNGKLCLKGGCVMCTLGRGALKRRRGGLGSV